MDKKKLSRYINKQNNLIDKAKEHGFTKCRMIKPRDEEYKKQLVYYYSEMIGYKVADDVIDFSHIGFLKDDNLFTEYVITQSNSKNKAMY